MKCFSCYRTGFSRLQVQRDDNPPHHTHCWTCVSDINEWDLRTQAAYWHLMVPMSVDLGDLYPFEA